MTFTEFMEKMEKVEELLAKHQIGRDEVQVTIFGERGDPHRMTLTGDGDDGLIQVVIKLQ